MTITLAPQTETKMKELADREGQDVNALVDTLLAASIEAAERDFEESCAAIAGSLESDPKHDIRFEEYQARFELEREARRQNRDGRTADLMACNDEPRRDALRFTPRAAAGIDAAHACSMELTDEEIADDWKAGLLEAIAPLAVMPHRQIAPAQVRFQQEIRQLIYRRRTGPIAYRVLFTTVESKDDATYVRILHVRHGAARPITRAEAKEIEAGA